MKKLAILLFLVIPAAGFACTTFCLQKNGQIIFGRNYDWVTGAGIVNTNHRGLIKSTPGKQSNLEWVSQYGSITFNQYGKEFPTGGMNEKGLVVELMWLDGTSYPEPDDRPEIGVLRWIQYQLDNNKTVAEVIKSDQKIRIQKFDTPLHYLVADAAGAVATIEFLDGKMKVHQNKDLPFPVLTNSRYDESIQVAGEYMTKQNLPGDNSMERFVKACNMLNKLKTDDVKMPLPDYAFSILDNVTQGTHTKWSIVYDIVNRVVYFKTLDFKNVKTFSFNGFDFACSNTPKMFDMNQPGSGDITKAFISPDVAIKKAALDKAVAESFEQVRIGEADKKFLLEYENTVTCK
jgi:penicillin V acylase-like amidase (Ntn superfamily)